MFSGVFDHILKHVNNQFFKN